MTQTKPAEAALMGALDSSMNDMRADRIETNGYDFSAKQIKELTIAYEIPSINTEGECDNIDVVIKRTGENHLNYDYAKIPSQHPEGFSNMHITVEHIRENGKMFVPFEGYQKEIPLKSNIKHLQENQDMDNLTGLSARRQYYMKKDIFGGAKRPLLVFGNTWQHPMV
jgi:hypothetical protein